MQANAPGIVIFSELHRKLDRLHQRYPPRENKDVRNVELGQGRHRPKRDVICGIADGATPQEDGQVFWCHELDREIVGDRRAERVDCHSFEWPHRPLLANSIEIGGHNLVDNRMPDARQIRPSHHLSGVSSSDSRNYAQRRNEGGPGINKEADQERRHDATEPLHGAAIMVEGHCSKLASAGTSDGSCADVRREV